MLQLRRNDPFEVLFRNFFDNDSFFNSVTQCKFEYPVDIYENENGLQIEIAAVGLDRKEIDINVEEGNILRVSYKKLSEDEESTAQNDKDASCIHRGIARRSFNLGWKIGKSFNIDELTATLDKGLLVISIPSAPKVEPKKIEIKVPHKQIKA